MRTRFPVLLLLASMLALLGSSIAVATPDEGPRQRVIVVLHDGTDARGAAHDAARAHGADVSHVYEHALQGFAASVPQGRLNALRNDARVASVEPDHWATTTVRSSPTQGTPGLGLKRSFHSGTVTVAGIASGTGVDVDVAVIDTGIDHTHPALNVVSGTDCARKGPMNSTCLDGLPGDSDGHGTHVAGTIGGMAGSGVLGVAPGARLHAVRVLGDNGGYYSWIIAGIDWVAARGDIEVANLSLGGSGSSDAMDLALTNLKKSGVAIAVSAGNAESNVTGYSPAGHPDVLTVSALADMDGAAGGKSTLAGCHAPTYPEVDDTFAWFSNFGDTAGDDVDIIAPGVCIESSVPGGYDIYSGTSMSSPHVAGGLALLASSAPNTSTAKDGAAVQSHYTDLLTAADGTWTRTANGSLDSEDRDRTKEPMLNLDGLTYETTLLGSSGGDDDATAPSVSITSPTEGATFSSGASISFAGSATDDTDGDLTSTLTWTSDVDGGIGTGPSFSATLTDGSHVITASTSDAAGNLGSASITITVGEFTSGPASMTVSSTTGTSSVGPGPNWDASVATTVVDVNKVGVSGATVSASWDDGSTTSCTTGNNGTCDLTGRFNSKHTTSATLTVTAVTASGYTWDGGSESEITESVTAP